ncbi:hypothetical protein EUTSA_v10025607mg [Eutrema salsugineum]|uniref:Peroxidase n=1 Tax=Eutrema salsugineum TaxID=72664 RepID=V4P3U7_EUTSA|nr:hypothetical protein EUTSA_v10025607mg [Eutrema salsugineum]
MKSTVEEDVSSFYVSIAEEDDDRSYSLSSDYYRQSCPSVERIVRKMIRDVHHSRPSIAPSLIRLLFHDCFVEGCDASVLLDSDGSMISEKEAPPNLSLKGLDVIDDILIVSCADIIVLAARESVKVAGGPRYVVETGRKDSLGAFKEAAERWLPSPNANLSDILHVFASKGFNEQETVSLLGAHSIGITHCIFFENRLYNFSGTGKPDPELNPEFLEELKAVCPFSAPSSSPSPHMCSGSAPSLPASGNSKNKTDGVIDLSFNNEGGDAHFGTRYYRRLRLGKGVMFADQQLTTNTKTELWVRRYSENPALFRADFEDAMIKLSNHGVLTGHLGQVRKSCSKVLPPDED